MTQACDTKCRPELLFNESGALIRAYSHTHTNTHTHTHTQTHTHNHTHDQTCTYTHTHRHAHTETHTHRSLDFRPFFEIPSNTHTLASLCCTLRVHNYSAKHLLL